MQSIIKGIIFTVLLGFFTVAAALEGWQFLPAPPGPLFGPAFWIEGETASVSVSCFRFNQDILPNPEDPLLSPVLLPRRLEVSVIWHKRAPDGTGFPAIINGITRDPGLRPPTPIATRINDGRVVTEDWKTAFGYKQYVQNDEAARFLRRLLRPTKWLTVSADFTDGKTRTDTFNLAGFNELLAGMTLDCAAVRPLMKDRP